MIRFCIWLLERSLRADLAEHVIGDLLEQQERGSLWMLRETISALWHLHARPHPRSDLVRSVLADLRIAARLLRRSPAFAFVSVLTLGLAIGATTVDLQRHRARASQAASVSGRRAVGDGVGTQVRMARATT